MNPRAFSRRRAISLIKEVHTEFIRFLLIILYYVLGCYAKGIENNGQGKANPVRFISLNIVYTVKYPFIIFVNGTIIYI